MNANLFLKNKMLPCAAYDCNNSSKNNSDKTFFILLKIERTGKAWIAAINQKQGTLHKNVFICFDHFQEACFDKSWVSQAQLFCTSRPNKRKLLDGSFTAVES